MINFNGYYLGLKEDFDSRAKDNLVTIFAFVFYKNGTYGISSKHEYSKYIKDFYIADLIDDGKKNGVFSINDNIISLKPNDKYGDSYELKILYNDNLYNTITKSNMFFISWEEHTKEMKNNFEMLKKFCKS